MSGTVSAEEITARVTSALVEFGADPDKLHRDADLAELDIDSLDLVELGQIVEEEYGAHLKGEDLESLRTFGDAIDLIMARMP